MVDRNRYLCETLLVGSVWIVLFDVRFGNGKTDLHFLLWSCLNSLLGHFFLNFYFVYCSENVATSKALEIQKMPKRELRQSRGRKYTVCITVSEFNIKQSRPNSEHRKEFAETLFDLHRPTRNPNLLDITGESGNDWGGRKNRRRPQNENPNSKNKNLILKRQKSRREEGSCSKKINISNWKASVGVRGNHRRRWALFDFLFGRPWFIFRV